MGQPIVGEIRQLALNVSDMEQALAFYVEVLGLPLLFRAGPALAFVAAGAVRLMLTSAAEPGAMGHNSPLYFQVPDSSLAYQQLLARGAAAERPPQLVAQMADHQLWIGFIRDPDGNLLGLLEERR